jgi:hypothetical protein
MDHDEIERLNAIKDLRITIKSVDFLGRGGTPEHFIGETFNVHRLEPGANGYINVYYDPSRFGNNYTGSWFVPLHCVTLLSCDDSRALPKKPKKPKLNRSW